MRFKNISLAILFILGFGTFGLQSCLEDKCDATRTYVQFNPVYMMPDQFRVDDIEMTSGKELETPGKIYVYKDYLLINELREGIHVYDNSNPENPVQISFIEIPGNVDMAIYNDHLYADSYVDLLTIDISDIQNPVLRNRKEDVFFLNGYQENRGYLVYYNETDITIEIDCSEANFENNWFRGGVDEVFVLADGANADAGASGQAGIGGSMARFTISQGHLYTIDRFNLKAWDLDNAAEPIGVDDEQVGWDIETIFPYKDMLFLGSTSGMYIYRISNPSDPAYTAIFEHANACDPVVVENDIAFITLRDGTRCQTYTNQLDVVDISNPIAPEFIKSYPMDHPHGLAVRDNVLYLCEGDYGLKVFDVSDLENIDKNKLDEYEGMNGYDVISLKNDLLLMIGSDGFYQFDSSDPKNLVQLSHIAVVK